MKDTSTGDEVITVSSKMGRETVVRVLSNSLNSTHYYRTETLPTGEVLRYRDGFGNSFSYFEDERHRLETEVVNDERFGSLYKRISRVKFLTNSTSSITEYDQVINYPLGITSDFFNFDSITQTVKRGSVVHTSVYEAATKTKTFTSHEGAVTVTKIDDYERPIEVKVGNEIPWTYTYDNFGRFQEVSQGGRKKRNYTYNAQGYVSKITNSLNEETHFTYDLSGRVTQITLPDSRVISYSYDANGNVTGITPPGRPQHVFAYNLMELLESYQPPSIGVGVLKDTTYSYNDWSAPLWYRT